VKPHWSSPDTSPKLFLPLRPLSLRVLRTQGIGLLSCSSCYRAPPFPFDLPLGFLSAQKSSEARCSMFRLAVNNGIFISLPTLCFPFFPRPTILTHIVSLHLSETPGLYDCRYIFERNSPPPVSIIYLLSFSSLLTQRAHALVFRPFAPRSGLFFFAPHSP